MVSYVSEDGKNSVMGRAREEGKQESRERERVDPVIKINHSAELHSTGQLTDTTCSTTVSFAYLGAHWERSHMYILIRMT